MARRIREEGSRFGRKEDGEDNKMPTKRTSKKLTYTTPHPVEYAKKGKSLGSKEWEEKMKACSTNGISMTTFQNRPSNP